MSLATRCPSCGTIFRVVQDQLKVCEGWVRCGRCDEVFSALVGLFDLERDPPPDWSPGASLPTAAPEPSTRAAAGPVAQIDVQHGASEVSDDGSPESLPQAADDTTDVTSAEATHGATGEGAQTTIADPAEGDEQPVVEPVLRGDLSVADPLAEGSVDDPPAPPGFVRDAQRQARWRRPAVRAVLGLAALSLLLLLAGQAAHHFRDLVAARWPEARPALIAWCSVADCTIEAPKHIAAVSVESSALNRAATPNAFKLALTLRNRGRVALALPAVELSLTDAAGQLVSRRALMPGDFRVASPLLAAGAEAPLQLVLNAGSARVTGYTVELFYP